MSDQREKPGGLRYYLNRSHAYRDSLSSSDRETSSTDPVIDACDTDDSGTSGNEGRVRVSVHGTVFKEHRSRPNSPSHSRPSSRAIQDRGGASSGSDSSARSGGLTDIQLRLRQVREMQMARASNVTVPQGRSASSHTPRPVFGVPLHELKCGSSGIPHVIQSCIDHIATHGLQTEGIFRTSPLPQEVSLLIDLFTADPTIHIPASSSNHAVAGLMLFFLHELPETLCATSTVPAFRHAVDTSDKNECIERLKLATTSLPAINCAVLAALVGLLRLVADNCRINAMATKPLAQIFGHVLFPTNIARTDCNATVSLMIDLFPFVFPDAPLPKRRPSLSMGTEINMFASRSSHTAHLQLVDGEGVIWSSPDFKLSSAGAPSLPAYSGDLVLTNYRFVFTPLKAEKNHRPTTVPVFCFSEVTRSASAITISCKDLRVLTLTSHSDPIDTFYDHLTLSRLPHFARFYTPQLPQERMGWNVFDATAEFTRITATSGSVWRLSRVNLNFTVCPSYPSLLAVPAVTSDDDLKFVAAFRSKGRIPVLEWIHPHTRACLTRSSQPRVGLARSRCSQDEQLIADLAAVSNDPNGSAIMVADARPKVNAMANTAIGAGYESPDHYPCIKLVFLGIENIHVVKDSLSSLQKALQESVASESYAWYSKLEATQWLQHLRSLLRGSAHIARTLHSEGVSVLVHCADGWDRTAQLSSLVQLLLDPYFRTLRGFQVLIEKSWVSMGFRFHDRCGHAGFLEADREAVSPIFLQFIDCVWQISQQYPCAFEFSESFLVALMDHVYSCRFGTFLCNCELERHESRIRAETVSVWSVLNASVPTFLNPLYKPVEGALHIRYDIWRITLWQAYYRRWYSTPDPALTVEQRVRELIS